MIGYLKGEHYEKVIKCQGTAGNFGSRKRCCLCAYEK